MASRKSSVEYEKQYQAALTVYAKMTSDPKPFFSQDVTQDSGYGYRVEKRCRLVSEQQFEDEFKTKAKDVGIALTTLRTETGEKCSGILLESPEPRSVVVFGEVQARMRQFVFDHNMQCRKDQGDEVSSWWRGGEGKPPKVWSREYVENRIKEVARQREQKEKQEELKLAMAHQEEEAMTKTALEPAQESEEEEEEVAAGTVNLFAPPAPKAKSQAKKKQERGGEGKQKRKSKWHAVSPKKREQSGIGSTSPQSRVRVPSSLAFLPVHLEHWCQQCCRHSRQRWEQRGQGYRVTAFQRQGCKCGHKDGTLQG